MLYKLVEMTFKRIIMATDFGDSATRALDLAVELAQKFEAGLGARCVRN